MSEISRRRVRVLVTGGAGFIGGHTSSRLVKEGHEVVVLDNMSTGREENLSDVTGRGSLELIKGDIRDNGLVEKVAQDIDAIVHLAAIISVPYSVAHPAETNDVNVNGTLNLLMAAQHAEVSKFIYTSTCAVYGEAEYLPIDEKHPKAPASPYAASKLCSEIYCETFHRAHGLNTTILRPFNIYGPRQERNPYAGVIVRFREQLANNRTLTIFGDGKQTRDFVHVFDVVEAICKCLGSDNARGQVLNIGSGRSISVESLAKLMSNLVGVDVSPKFCAPRLGDILHSQADIRKAKSLLGYEPKINIEEGLRMLVTPEGARAERS